MEIECVAQREIVRLKAELAAEKEKGKSSDVVDCGVNTE